MARKSARSGGGIGFLGLLGLLFIGLRLAGLIDWPWWVVLAPIWAQLAILAACFLILGILAYLEDR